MAEESTSKIGTLIMLCFHARTVAHVQHLATRSYAAHVALNGFYDAVVVAADAIAEAYQGRYGLIEMPATRYTFDKDPVGALRALRRWIDENREAVCDCSEIQNLIDELLHVIDEALYKLRFLA